VFKKKFSSFFNVACLGAIQVFRPDSIAVYAFGFNSFLPLPLSD
jgi:hypothetical protein